MGLGLGWDCSGWSSGCAWLWQWLWLELMLGQWLGLGLWLLLWPWLRLRQWLGLGLWLGLWLMACGWWLVPM